MSFEMQFEARDEHIDFQGVMDGLYYPFYIEECRHKYILEELAFDIQKEAENGINMVLSHYTIKFRRPLVKGDLFIVTCSAHPDERGAPRVHFRQKILKDGKVTTDGVFSATCVRSSGGGAFIPDSVAQKIESEKPISN